MRLLAPVVAAMSTLAIVAVPVTAQDPVIDGDGPLAFGMTFEEARDAAGKAWKTGCGGQYTKVWRCLNTVDFAFGYEATVLAKFGKDTRSLDKFLIKIERLRFEACEEAVANTTESFRESYGKEIESEHESSKEWQLAGGVRVSIAHLCSGGMMFVGIEKVPVAK